jgi:hypothetical protein
MDPETPRTLGDLEDSEPERRPAMRSNPVKRTLDEFLVAFEEGLRDHPDEAATSATAALEGRADGSWRTPIEGGERTGRRLPRRVPRRQPEGESPPGSAAAQPSPALPTLPEPPPAEVDAVDQELPAVGADLAAAASPDATEPAGPAGVPATAEPAGAAKRRNRHRRRHRHR